MKILDKKTQSVLVLDFLLSCGWLLSFLDAFVDFTILTELFINMMCISSILFLILLYESFDEFVEVIVEAANFVFHILLEGDASNFNLVD